MLGARVALLHEGLLASGKHGLRWNATNAADHPVADGIYILRLKTATASKILRIQIMH